MVVHKINNVKYHIDGKLKAQLDYAKRCLKDNWDMLFIITSGGKPGSGKTTIGTQIASYIDPVFSIKECVFKATDLIKQGLTMNRRPFSMQYDEAKETLNKKRQMTEQFHNIEMFFDECRQFNPFLILCTPNLFDLPKQLVINRASAVIDVYYVKDKEGGRRVRGRYKFYGDASSKYLYLSGFKYEDYSKANPDFRGTFSSAMTIDPEEYRQKKLEAARERFKKKVTADDRTRKTFSRCLASLRINEGITTKRLAHNADTSEQYINSLIRDYTESKKER